MRREMKSAGGDDSVVLFAFAQEEMFAEEEIGGGDGALEVGFADVVEVDAAALDVFTGLSFGGRECGVDEKFDERNAGTFEFGFFEVLGGDFADNVVEGGFGNAGEFAAEKNFAGANGFRCGLFAVDEIGHRLGECLVGNASAGIGGVLLLKRDYFVLRHEGKEFQVADDVAVVGVDPELVEAVDAGFFGVDPDGPSDALAEFGAVSISYERQSKAENVSAEFFAAEIAACGDVAPLITAADLEFAVELFAQVIEIESLEEHVAELGVADASLTVFHAGANTFLGNHHVHGKMFADVAEEIEEADGSGPGGVIEQACGIGRGVEIE